jgi:hypothetical protein
MADLRPPVILTRASIPHETDGDPSPSVSFMSSAPAWYDGFVMALKAILITLLLLPSLSVLSICQGRSGNRDQIESHGRMARQYLSQLRPNLATPEFQQLVTPNPGNVDALELDQLDKALRVLEQAIQKEPTKPAAHYRLSTLCKKQGRVDDAKREVDLYKKLKELKDQLRSTYKGLLMQPNEIRAGERNAD